MRPGFFYGSIPYKDLLLSRGSFVIRFGQAAID
jgi:hypothetical protein